MKSRQLGQQGFDVSEVGLGCWQLGSDWGSVSEESSLAILEAAVTNGVTFFDTADVYGNGLSETVIGKFLRQSQALVNQNPVKVATKFGRKDGIFPNGYTEEALRRATEGSLERLGVDSLDLLQLHCIPTEVLRKGEVFDWLRRLQQDGLIQHFGASVESVEEGLICLQQEGLLSLQVIFNLFRQKLATELLPQAQEKGVGIIVRLPLASGLLSGKYTRDTTFPADDHRNYNRNGEFFNVGETFAGLPFEQGVNLADQLKEYLPEGMDLAQMAMRWILDHKAVSTIIPGATSPEQAARNARIPEASLPEPLMQSLYEFYNSKVQQHIRGPY